MEAEFPKSFKKKSSIDFATCGAMLPGNMKTASLLFLLCTSSIPGHSQVKYETEPVSSIIPNIAKQSLISIDPATDWLDFLQKGLRLLFKDHPPGWLPPVIGLGVLLASAIFLIWMFLKAVYGI